MKLFNRFLVIAGVVGTGLAIQGLLYAHLHSAPQMESGSLSGALTNFPLQLGQWQGRDVEMDEASQYADEHLKRAYRKGRFELILWMVFSGRGEDRQHNPEVCLSVHGHTEDPAGQKLVEIEVTRHVGDEVVARTEVDVRLGDQVVESVKTNSVLVVEEVEGERLLVKTEAGNKGWVLETDIEQPSPVQRYRFTHPQGEQLVYYWHYALPTEEVEGLTSVQRFYQEVRKRRASITLQVFAPDVLPEESVEFVKLADGAVQEFVGPEAVRSCKRRPLTFIEE